MSSLYELTGDFLKVQEMLENEEFDKETLKNTLECIDFEIELKSDGYGKVIKNLETQKKAVEGQRKALKTALDDEIIRLKDKEQALDNRIKYLKENLGQAMKTTGKEKIKTDLFSFYFKKTPSVNIIDEKKALESDFVRVKKEVDKSNLLKAMKEGKTFDFVEIKESESLVIK